MSIPVQGNIEGVLAVERSEDANAAVFDRAFRIYVKNMHVPQHLLYSARHAELRTLFRLMCAANRKGRI